MSWQQSLQEYAEFLKQKHDLTDEDLKQALFSESIPADVFASQLTPLQTAATYLREHYDRTVKEIARTLGRTTTEVEQFLSKTKALPKGQSGLRIPAQLFADKGLAASEHLVEWLEQQGLSVAEIAELIGKSERTVWTLHYRIGRKRGDRDA